MSRPAFIARKDHEVYFFDITDIHALSRKKTREFATEKLLECHPGFSSDDGVDLRRIPVGRRVWLMVTVMRRDDLEEYRLLNRGKRLVTSTSVVTSDRRALESGIGRYGDEAIGYSAEDGGFVSLPVFDGARLSVGAIDLEAAAKKTRASVFAKNRMASKTLVALFTVFGILVATASFPSAYHSPQTDLIRNENQSEPLPLLAESRNEVPGAFSILRDVCSVIGPSMGTLDRFQFDEAADPPVLISLCGSAPIPTRASLASFPYFIVEDVARIEYQFGVPCYSIQCAFDTAQYSVSSAGEVARGDVLLALIQSIDEQNARTGVAVSAQTVDQPAVKSSGISNSVSMTVSWPVFSRLLANICERIDSHSARLTKLTITVDRRAGTFHVTYSIGVGIPTAVHSPCLSRSETVMIADAFGFRMAEQARKSDEIASLSVPEGFDRIGKITAMDGSASAYYRNGDGKIFVRGE